MLSGKIYMEEDMLFAKIVSHKFDFSKLRLINGQCFNKQLQVLTTMSMYNQFCCNFKISCGVYMKHNQRLNLYLRTPVDQMISLKPKYKMWRVFYQPIGTFVYFLLCIVRILHSITTKDFFARILVVALL